ncbi:hypothetical protein EXM36_09930 [Clostridium botulinum]|nr:hypothetical protein [Clostridium botulinum]NCI37259.1 hypothetical protein [Clostridium botulinum]NCI71170.1 hypothetical protein [Clostridium botulinum]NDI38585.1 hypothetical protein [Clostridium botulinum]NEZ71019.1 hypothetical protein [Clostridium botulinum]
MPNTATTGNRTRGIIPTNSIPCITHAITNGKFLYYVAIHKINEKEIIIADNAKSILKYTF